VDESDASLWFTVLRDHEQQHFGGHLYGVISSRSIMYLRASIVAMAYLVILCM
jgi:hypothetical protein